VKQLWDSNTELSTESFLQKLNSEKYDQDEVLCLCEEYFEIAIGIRKPTEKERDESGRILIQSIFSGGDQINDLDRIRVAKYPLNFSKQHRYEVFSIIEYTVFKKLAKETDKLGGPYIPMLRAEIFQQLEDFRNGNMVSALIRQSACFETYCRMKLGRTRKTQWKHLNVSNISIFEKSDREFLNNDLRDTRDDHAHDWRVYLTERRDQEELRQVCRDGLGLLSKLHKKETIKTYQENCNKHISERYPSEWRDRDSGDINSSASATIGITCEHCEHQFIPEREGWKRCPECDTPHDYLER